MSESPVIPCGVAIIRRDGQFLISQRKDEDSFGSFWEFPGGKKNHWETFEECVAREVREEVGIEIAVHEKFMEMKCKYHEKIIWLNFYLCDVISGEPKPVDCQKVEWAKLENLESYKFPPANEQVISKLNHMFGVC